MTDQETKSGAPSAGTSLVMVEQTTESRHKSYRPTELQDEAPIELHHKRSRAPAVPSVAEESSGNPTMKDRMEREHTVAEKQSYTISAKLSSKRPSSPESIVMDVKRAEIISQPSQPIPMPMGPSESTKIIDKTENKDNDSGTEEIAELRPSESRNWSDDGEEAGGLPRSESRSSRISRAWRQLFCCGVRYESPSEHNIPTTRGVSGGI